MTVRTPDAPPGDRELWVFLREGLCNRLRVLLSAIGQSDVTGRRVVVRWPTSTGRKVPALLRLASHKPFRARITDLFDLERCVGLREVGRWEWHRMRRAARAAPAPFPPPRQHPAEILWLDRYDSFYEELPQPPAAYARRLAVRPELLDWAARARGAFSAGRPRLGFHVRKVRAHGLTLAASPLTWFEAEVRRALGACGEHAPFFLSVDDISCANALHTKFPGALVESSPPPAYNSVRGIQKGLVDLTVLAACDHIVGSHFSSFSTMAHDLQGRRSYSDSQRPLVGSYTEVMRESGWSPAAHPWLP
jgi:hypothetical protein